MLRLHGAVKSLGEMGGGVVEFKRAGGEPVIMTSVSHGPATRGYAASLSSEVFMCFVGLGRHVANVGVWGMKLPE